MGDMSRSFTQTVICQVRANPELLSELYTTYQPAEPGSAEEADAPPDGAKGHWDKRLTDFQKLIFVKTFTEDKVRDVHLFAIHSVLCVLVNFVCNLLSLAMLKLIGLCNSFKQKVKKNYKTY